LHILGGKVDLIVLLELVDQGDDVGVVLAEAHGIGLADLLFAGEALILGRIHALESHFHTGLALGGQPDGVARALADRGDELILVELAGEALEPNDGKDDALAHGKGLEVDLAVLVLAVDQFDWIPFALFFSNCFASISIKRTI